MLFFLGDMFDVVLENGEVVIKFDFVMGKFMFVYYDNYYLFVLVMWQGCEVEILVFIDKVVIVDLYECQLWKLMFWCDVVCLFLYWCFFEVIGLVGMWVEDKIVFDDIYWLILELVRMGVVDGLCIDYIDGFVDLKVYFVCLCQEVGLVCYIIVEKIFVKGE